MKNKDIAQMTEPELFNLIDTLEKERLNLKIQGKTGQLKNSARLTAIRKDVARAKTELRRRSLQQKKSKQSDVQV